MLKLATIEHLKESHETANQLGNKEVIDAIGRALKVAIKELDK